MIKNKKNFFFLLFFLICFFLIYRTSFNSFFSQDDFYHLALARVESWSDFFNFFNPWVQKDVHFRPLGTQVFFAIAHLFPQNLAPLVLRLIALAFHLANFYLVFLLLKRFLKKETLAVVLAGFYLLAPLHFMSLYYISAFQQILATFFQLLAFWFFALGKKKWVFFCFILALFSKETAIVFPGLLLIFSYIIRPEKKVKDYFNRVKKNWRFWLILFLLLIFYGFFRFLTFVNYPGDNYQLLLSPRTLISSWRWYLIWLMGAPETIIRYAGRFF
ncbi:MAG: transmembrane(s)proteins 7..26, partial [Microgenomates bacterium 39_6]